MSALDYKVPFETVNLGADSAKSVVGLKSPTNQANKIIGLNFGADGTDATKGPILVEICHCTFATNAPGTNSTSVTPVADDSGRPETIQSTAAKNWTTEPTVITVWEAFYVPSFGGSAIIYLPLTKPMIVKGGAGMVVRCTRPSGFSVNVTGSIKAEE